MARHEKQRAAGRPLEQKTTEDLLKQAATQAADLAEKQVELAKVEASGQMAREQDVAEGLGVAGGCVLIGVQSLFLAGIFGLARLMPDWAAALAVAGVTLASGLVAGTISARRRVKHAMPKTQASLTGDLRWLRDRLT